MKIRNVLYLLFGFIVAATAHDESFLELAKKLQKDRKLERTASLVVPADQRDGMIKYLRKVRDREIYGNGTAAEILLINLNDQEHIEQVFADFLQSEHAMVCKRAGNALRRCSQVEIIPMLAEYLNEGDDTVKYRNDKMQEILLATHSIGAGSISMHILTRSPDVPVDVQEWAKECIDKWKPHPREIMREWWPENKQHFETKEYHKLRPPGAEHPPEESKAAGDSPPESTVGPKPEPAITYAPGAVETGAPDRSACTTEPSGKPPGRWKSHFPIFGIFSIFILLAFIFSMLRKTSDD